MEQNKKSFEYLERLSFQCREFLDTIIYSLTIPINNHFPEEDLETLDKAVDNLTHLLYEYWKLKQPEGVEIKIDPPIEDTFKRLMDLATDLLKTYFKDLEEPGSGEEDLD